LNKNGRLSEQPPQTSRDLVNVVPVDWTTGRLRGSIRSGSSAYFSGYMAGIGHKVQALHSFPYQARHVSYSADPIPNELWAVSLAQASTVSVIESGLYDDFFAVIDKTRLVHYSRYGIELGAIDIPGLPIGASGPLFVVGKIHVAEDGAIYVAASDWISTLSGVGPGHIYKFQLAADNRGLEIVWHVFTNSSPSLVQGMHVAGDSLWTLETQYVSTTVCSARLVEYKNINTASGPGTGDRYDHLTIDNAAITALDALFPAGGTAVFGHDMAMRTVGETSWIIAVGTVHDASSGVWAQLKIKSDFTLSANYCFVNNEVAVSAVRGGGVGFAVAVDVTGNVYSMGRRATGDPSSGSWVRMLSDTTTAWLKVWERANATDLGAAATNPGYSYPSIALDYSSNLVVPTCVSSTSVAAAKIIKPSGVLYSSIVQYVYVAGVPTVTANETRAVAVPTTHPDYQPDDYPVTDTVFISGTNVVTLTSETTGGSIQGYDTLLETALQTSSRAICRLGVANGAIYRFTTAGVTNPTNSTGRSPVLSTNSRFVQAADFDGEVFWTDGQDYAVYRPLPGDATNPDGEIVEWRATSLGLIPPRARLICRWRNRIVLAHTADSPWSWHMSAYNDPYDWDLFPPEPLETQAVSGQALPAAGDSPDLIHALVPWSDDLLFIGCSRSILRVDGDPMAGGRISVVSDKIGMAFGSPWCKDPEGRIYFFGSSGGVYVMSPTGELQWLTRDTIEEEISDVDLSTYRVEMTWNSRDNGLHVWILPYEDGGVQVRHYFWSQRTGGWFPMEFGTTAITEMQPTAVHVIDGDTAAERVMIFGTEDGRVLKWDPLSSGDDSQPIDARVLIGPIAGPEGDFEARFKRPSVILARELGGVHVKFFASETAETPEMPKDQVRVGPGRNLRLPIQCRGPYCWMQLRSATRTSSGVPALSERWAVESITVDAFPAGRAHGIH
jgi:hypothetical protein